MPIQSTCALCLTGAILLFAFACGEAASPGSAPATMRVDYVHSGNANTERFSVDGIYREGPWPGPSGPAEDPLGAGKYRFLVRTAGDGRLLYSRGFASIYGEWETTERGARIESRRSTKASGSRSPRRP